MEKKHGFCYQNNSLFKIYIEHLERKYADKCEDRRKEIQEKYDRKIKELEDELRDLHEEQVEKKSNEIKNLREQNHHLENYDKQVSADLTIFGSYKNDLKAY